MAPPARRAVPVLAAAAAAALLLLAERRGVEAAAAAVFAGNLQTNSFLQSTNWYSLCGVSSFAASAPSQANVISGVSAAMTCLDSFEANGVGQGGFAYTCVPDFLFCDAGLSSCVTNPTPRPPPLLIDSPTWNQVRTTLFEPLPRSALS